MRKPFLFLLSCLILLGVSAKPPKGFTAHPDGMYYRIIRLGTDVVRPVYGDYIFMHLIKHHPVKQEVFSTHIFNNPEGVEFLLAEPEKKPDVIQVFTLMHEGDSAIVKIPANRVDSSGSRKKYYTFYLKLVSFKRRDIYDQEKSQAYFLQRQTDSLLILNYLETHAIQSSIRDSLGIVYKKTKTGDGELLRDGDTVKLHYKGFLTNGFEFDNSYFRNDPLVIVLGNRQVIDGLDIGLHYFRKGESGTMLIPSNLGYASREVGKIPPNSVLIFDIDILP